MFPTTSILWDQLGQPIFFVHNDWLISLQGNVLGFIDREGAVYNNKRMHVAWFEGGVLRDYHGHCLALTEAPDDPIHPPLPISRIQAPTLPSKIYPLVQPVAALAAPKPHPRYTWSSQAPHMLFS